MRRDKALLISIVVSPPRFNILRGLCGPDPSSELANSRNLEACQGPRVFVSTQPGRPISSQIDEHFLLQVRARIWIFAGVKTSTIMTIFKPGNCILLLLICASTSEVCFLFTISIQVIMSFILWIWLINSIFMDACTAFGCVVYIMCFVLGPLLNGIGDDFLVLGIFSCLSVSLLLQAVYARLSFTPSILLIGMTLCGFVVCQLPRQGLCASTIVTSCHFFLPKLGPTWQSFVLFLAMSCTICSRIMFKPQSVTYCLSCGIVIYRRDVGHNSLYASLLVHFCYESAIVNDQGWLQRQLLICENVREYQTTQVLCLPGHFYGVICFISGMLIFDYFLWLECPSLATRALINFPILFLAYVIMLWLVAMGVMVDTLLMYFILYSLDYMYYSLSWCAACYSLRLIVRVQGWNHWCLWFACIPVSGYILFDSLLLLLWIHFVDKF